MRFAVMVVAMVWAGALGAQQAADAVAPEAAGVGVFEGMGPQVRAAFAAKAAGEPVVASDWMVAAANPHAVKAGADVLAKGGTAADALVAVQLMLGLVEPQSSGLGGGAFLVWYDGTTGMLTTLDARETAPLAATPRRFQDAQGEPLSFFDAVVGGRSVGVPGTPALLDVVHDRWGVLGMDVLTAPVIAKAEEGFAVSPRLAGLIARDQDRLGRFAQTSAYFMPSGVPLAAGDILRNPAYAQTVRMMAQDPAWFYVGANAERVVQSVNDAMDGAGLLSTVDLSIYQVKERAPVCAGYREYDVCGMGPPSSGAVAVGQILGMLDGADLSAGPQDPKIRRLMGDAARLAFADRGRYLADSDFVPVPVQGLLAPDYLADRAQLLEGERALAQVAPGTPEFDHALLWADDVSIELPSTSHITIVDSAGNVASMTTTIENAFGSRIMVNGYLLNNELTDFSFRSHRGGVPIANRVEPVKRPRSSMAPTIVMKDGAPVLAVGSPGGSRIIGYVAGAIVAHLDWGLDVQQAVSLPHAVNRFGSYDLEEGTSAIALEGPLTAMGYEIAIRPLTSGLHMIAIGDDLRGGADPRREGIVLGD